MARHFRPRPEVIAVIREYSLRWSIYCACAAVVLAMSFGCEPIRTPGFPLQTRNDTQLLKQLDASFDVASRIIKYYETERGYAELGMTFEQQRMLQSLRSEIVQKRLTLINLSYNHFIADVSINRQAMDLSTDLADLGVDLAATVSGAAAVKTALSAISAGITGTQASLHKNIYLDRTVGAIIASMNARRKEALLPILEGMNRSIDEYPLAQALVDLDNYYLAGTFLGGLEGIQRRAAEAELAADAQLRRFSAMVTIQPEQRP